MQILRLIFRGILGIFKFINNYFKALIFLLILFFVFAPSGKIKEPNLARIDIVGTILDTSEILESLEKARLDNNIKGVLLLYRQPRRLTKSQCGACYGGQEAKREQKSARLRSW